MASDTVPVIDINRLGDRDTLDAIDFACRRWGFFQVTSHGLDAALIEALQRTMHDFFALPLAAKHRVLRTRENPWGYYDKELTKNVRDWKEVFDYGPGDGEQLDPRWPEGLPAFRQVTTSYAEACERLAFQLLEAISKNLATQPDYLATCFGTTHSSFLRLNYYPVCPEPERPEGLNRPEGGHLGVSHHTDAGVLTVLLQDDQPGLEVYRDGVWHLVEPRDDALVVNIGDIVQVWSNDRYRAALHRAITNPHKARYSVPYFLNPGYETDYAPLPSMIDAQHPAHYRSINWGEFRALRADGDYADYGEEVQISHYRI
jgi:isopenicillin N synthase-like dioxygenase